MFSLRQRGRRAVRVLGWVLAAALVLVLALGVAGIGALQSHPIRQWLVARASSVLEARVGARLSADDLRVDVVDGRVELHGPRLTVGGAAPFLTARRLVVEVDPGSLRRGPLVVRSVLVEDPTLDLAAPLPVPPPEIGQAPGTPAAPPQVEQLRLTGGSVRGGAVSAGLGPWLQAWALDDLTVSGSLRGGVVSLVLEGGRLDLSRGGPGTRQLALTGRVDGPLGGPLIFRDLRVTGDGLELAAGGEVALEAAVAVAATVHADVAPGRVVPDLGLGGAVRLDGSFTTAPLEGELKVVASGLAVDAARAFVDAAAFDRVGAAGTNVDLEARVVVRGDPLHPEGTVEATWRRGAGVLALARAGLADSGGSVVVDLDVALLPGAVGVRSLRGRLAAASLVGLGRARIEAGEVDWRCADLAGEVALLRGHWPGLVPAPPPGLDLRGPLAVRVSASGGVADPEVVAEASWQPTLGGSLEFRGSGRPLVRVGRAQLSLAELPLALAWADGAGTLSGELTAAVGSSSVAVEANLDGRAITVEGAGPRLDEVHLEAATDGKVVEVRALSATSGPTRLDASGRVRLATPVTDATLELVVERPVPQVGSVSARVVLAGGTVRVLDGVVDTMAGTAFVDLEAPLGTVAGLPHAAVLRELPLRLDHGPLHLTVLAPGLDSCRLTEAFALPDREERLRTDLAAEVWLDPDGPALASGYLRASALEASVSGATVTAVGPLVLRLDQARAVVEPLRFRVAGTEVTFGARADLAADWRLGDDPLKLVDGFSAEASGRVAASLLEPYAAGAVAAGSLDFTAALSGAPTAPRASFSLRGDDASLSWTTPYPLRVSQPELEGGYGDGAFTLWSGRLAVNNGTVTLRGTVDRSGRGEIQAELQRLRLRLDYGLRAIVSGETVLTLWPDERPRLAGTIVVDRGVLDRDLDLEREVLGQFLAPVVTAGTEDNPLDRVDLDLVVTTTDGVRVKNNLADLSARWDRIEVGGTAWNPLMQGTVTIDPGGLVYAYGQTVRIDRGELQFTGDPIADPRIELTTTGSWQDPTIPAAGQEVSPFAGARGNADVQVLEAFSTGIAGYYGERVASRIGESLGLGRISLRPVLVFGETDPSARLTISRDLSRTVALAVSLDLRNAQRQTYVLDVRDLPGLGSFRAQAFTNDDGNEGGVLQQVLEFGGGRVGDPTGPVFDGVVWESDGGVPRRVLRRAVSLERGRPLPDGAAFDLEVELEHELRRAGWPAASVAVEERPGADDGRVALVARVEPGPRVRFEFTGDVPPRSLRPGIVDLYRPGPGEAATLAEVRKQTVRVLRGAGFLDPEVEVVAERTGKEGGGVAVTVRCHGGVRASLGPPRFEGVPEPVGAHLAARFPGAVERAELALGLADADRRAIAALQDLGYPRARIDGRSMTLDGHELVVRVDPGPLRTVAEVSVEGVAGEQHQALRRLLPLRPGDPLRRDLVGRGAAAMEELLRAEGYARAAVRASVAPVPGDELPAAVRYEVRTGQRYELGDVSIVGARRAGERAARRLAALTPGAPYRRADLAAARGRLLNTGLYGRVVADTDLGDGRADVTLELVERSRYQVAYGVRWESDVGTSAVVDLLDRNLLGRGITTGVRLRWEPDDRAARLFVNVPGVLGWPIALETFGERRREVRGGLVREVSEAALQLSLAISDAATGRVYARYSDTRLSEVEPDPFFPFEVRIRHPYVGVQVVHDRRDDLLQPRSGLLATLDLSGSGGFLGSDFEYVRGYGQLNLYRVAGRLAGRPLVWAQSYRAGVAHAFSQELIPDARLYGGGEFSLRGYPFEGVGPVEVLGDTVYPLGGEALLVINQELRLALPWDLTGVGFVDLGGVWADVGDFGSDLVTSLGLGIRAATPVGLLRIDFAVPLDRREWEPRFKLYAGFGNAF